MGLQDHRLGEVAVLLLGGHGRHALNVEVHVRDRGARLDAHLHDPRGQHGPIQVGPLAVADAVLDRADHRGRLVPHHRETGVQEAVASVLRAVTRRFQAPVIVGGLLVHERDDLRTGQRRVHRLEQRRDARDVRGGQRRARRIAVNLRDPPIGVGGVDPLPRCSEVNGRAVVRSLCARQGRPQRIRVPVLHANRGDRGNAADLRRDHPRTFNGTVRDRRRIRRRVAVCRRMVDVDASVTGARDHSKSSRLGVVNRALGGFKRRRLLGIRRAPVHPRVHLVGVVDDVHLVARRPLVGTHEGLRVEQLRLVERLDGHERRPRRDAVDADVVVIGRNDAGDVRAVPTTELPGVLRLVRDAIDGAGDGAGGVHAPLQVGLRLVDTGVNDADSDGLAGHDHVVGASGLHGLGAPVCLGGKDPAIRIRDSVGGYGGVICGRRLRGCRCGCRRCSCRRYGRVVTHGAFAVGYGGHAGRADGVNAHPGLSQGSSQIRRERGRLTLGEQRAQLGIAGQENAADLRNQVGGAGHLALSRAGVEVDGVVHEARAGAGRRNQTDVIVGTGRRGGHRDHAHGQSESRDETDACNGAMHGSSTFSCHCAWATSSMQ